MRINSIDLVYDGVVKESCDLTGASVGQELVVIRATGLDADALQSRFLGSAISDPQMDFNEISRDKRIIDIFFDIQSSNAKNSEVRDRIYRLISPGRSNKIVIQFKSNKVPVAEIDARIIKVESELFQQTPTIKVSFECLDPLFRAPIPTELDLFNIGTEYTLLDDLSTAPHGLSFKIKFLANTSTFTMQDDASPSWTFQIIPGPIGAVTGFQTNDVLTISSESSPKEVSILRANNVIHIIDKITATSIWPAIYPTYNNFKFVTGAFEWIEFKYTPKYWGV